MTEVFLLPDLGEGLTSAEIVRWLVDVGDTVTIDQPVVEVETAKSVVELPCPHAGVVTARHGAPGDELPVGTELLRVSPGGGPSGAGGAVGSGAAAPPGGASPGALRAPAGAGGGVPAGSPEAGASGPASAEGGGAGGPVGDEGSGPVLVGYGTVPVVPGGTPPTHGGGAAMPSGDAVPTTPSAPAGAGAAGPDGARGGAAPSAPRPPAGAGSSGPAVPGPAAGAVGAAPTAPSAAAGAGADGPARPAVAVVSPLVRRLAREVGVDLRSVTGTGPGGLIMRADVLNASPHPARGEAAPAGGLAAPGDVVVEMRGVARVMAERVAASRRDVADATCWVEADATGLMEARRVVGVPVTALLARICLAALARHPQLNASVDMAARRITRHGAVHLGFAAATERGLLVPVVRDAHAMDTGRLAAELRRLTEGARAGTLAPAEVTGSTFTLNNYGVFGVDGSTPIVNAPEVGMLGVGRIVEKPWAHEGRLALRQVVQLSLTFDHRACDGAVAGGFLRFVADRVEQPLALLGDL